MGGKKKAPPSFTREQRDALRAALAAMVSEGVKLTRDALRKRAGVSTTKATQALAEYRAGRFSLEDEKPAPKPPPSPPLVDGGAPTGPPPEAPTVEALRKEINEASSPADLQACNARALDLLLFKEIDTTVANSIQKLLTEARLIMAEARKVEPPAEEPTKYLLMTASAMKLCRMFDHIASDERRELVLEVVREALEDDQAEQPEDTDMVGSAADKESSS